MPVKARSWQKLSPVESEKEEERRTKGAMLVIIIRRRQLYELEGNETNPIDLDFEIKFLGNRNRKDL